MNLYKQHWWKCTGLCKDRPPFFGMVKRSMNRAPGPTDTWWSQHKATCNGSFVKVKEPEGFAAKKKAKGDLELNPGQNYNNIGVYNYANLICILVAKKVKIAAGDKDIRGFLSSQPSTSSGSTEGNTTSAKKPVATEGRDIRGFFTSPVENRGNVNSSQGVHGAAGAVFPSKGKSLAGGTGTVRNKGSSTVTVTKADEPSPAKAGSSQGIVAPTFVPFSGKGNISGWKKSDQPTPQKVTHLPQKTQSKPQQIVDILQKNQSKTPQIVDLTDSPTASKPTLLPCPVCSANIREDKMNEHLDWCLNH